MRVRIPHLLQLTFTIMNYLSADRLAPYIYTSKVFTILPELGRNGVVFVVYNEKTKEVVEMCETGYSAFSSTDLMKKFEELKTKHILDYACLYSTPASKKSNDSGVYDFKERRSRLLGR